jgi:DNA-binding winged helix-turn-helix (wHTH) protein
VTYRFGDFTLHLNTRRLLRQHQEVHLSPKAFDLLQLLVESSSRALAKNELHEKLWPETHVEDTNLASLVAEIRRALGDSADSPVYVRTMHRFGYWFIGAVQSSDDEEDDDPAVPPVRYWLIWETRQIPLNVGDNIVGRAPDATVWLDAPGVSRHHARIRLEGSEAFVEDLGSKNGTYIGGEKVSGRSLLADGDQIRLGSIVVTFRIPPPVATTDTVRES